MRSATSLHVSRTAFRMALPNADLDPEARAATNNSAVKIFYNFTNMQSCWMVQISVKI